MVEMALVLPILVVILFGILDFGRALNYWNNLNQVSANAARFAAVGRNPGNSVPFNTWVRSQLETAELREGSSSTGSIPNTGPNAGTQVCVDYPKSADPANPRFGDPVRIVLKARYSLMQPLTGNNGIAGFWMRGEAVMRLERRPDMTVFPATSGGCDAF